MRRPADPAKTKVWHPIGGCALISLSGESGCCGVPGAGRETITPGGRRVDARRPATMEISRMTEPITGGCLCGAIRSLESHDGNRQPPR